MKKILVVLFPLVFLSCSQRMRWLDVVPSDVTLIYNDNNSMSQIEKEVNKEASFITCVFLYDVPENVELKVEIISGDKCVSLPTENEKILPPGFQITPIKAGKCKIKVSAQDSDYGFDTFSVTVYNKSEL